MWWLFDAYPMNTKRRSREEWVTLLDEMSESGLTQTEWCRQNSINYKTMRAMKDTMKKASAPDASTTDVDWLYFNRQIHQGA
jgi:hypothetical protein